MRKLQLLVSILALAAAGAAAQPVTIGAAGAVKGRVEATAPGQVGRVVQSGKPVFLNDHVTTDAAGRLQVLLLDETVFTLGPNADLVLDEFFYNPGTHSGKIAAQVSKGVFRFVTGRIARKQPSAVNVRVPSGTIGIRGTIVAGVVQGAKAAIVLLGPGPNNNAGERAGAIAVGNSMGTVNITRTNYSTTISGPAEAPTPPSPAPPALMAQIGDALGEKPAGPQGGGGGGAGGGGGEGEGGAESSSGGDDAAGASGNTAGEESGQATAAGGDTLETTESTSQLAAELAPQTTIGTQETAKSESILDGIATWEQVRGVPSGSGCYTGAGTYTCTNAGGLCVGGGGGNFQIDIDYNFATRVLGAGDSFMTLTSGPLAGQGGGASTTLVSGFSYAGLEGDATKSLAGLVSNSFFDGTSISLKNVGGVVAKQVSVNLGYNNGTATAGGSGTASR